MLANDICRKAREIASKKTTYVKKCPGLALTQANKLRYTGLDPFNTRNSKKIFAVSDDTLGYDEFTFFSEVTGIKSDDLKNVIANCTDISKDFSNILPGEIVFGNDRFGIFVGGHDVVAVNNLGVGMTIIEGWASHGKLPGVDYSQILTPYGKETEDAEREVDRNVSAEEVEAIIEEPVSEPEDAPEVAVRPSSFRRRH